METLKVGSFAYYDSFSGLIPCKVIALGGPSGTVNSNQRAAIKLTAPLGPYKTGEKLYLSCLQVVPRKAVRFRKYGTRILCYNVETGQ